MLTLFEGDYKSLFQYFRAFSVNLSGVGKAVFVGVDGLEPDANRRGEAGARIGRGVTLS